MISTRDLSLLPDLTGFRRIARSLATLDAVLSPEWEYRYYAFDSAWGDGEIQSTRLHGGAYRRLSSGS